MFTRANGIVNLYRWIPWVSIGHSFARPNHGDPFVTPVSPKVTLRLLTDRPLVVATSGRRIAASGLRQTFEATNVRDFALVAAPDFRVASRRVGNVLITAFVRPGVSATPRLAAAAAAISGMQFRVGAMPYSQLLVTQTAGGYGMEAPGMVWIPTGVASSNLRYLVTHEVAHQWFYALVGNNQATAPFTDEAAADFLARNVLGARRSSRCGTVDLDRSIYEYSAGCYYEVVYIQGGNLLEDLRRRMGDAAFWPGLRAYLDANRWGLAPPRALLDTLDAFTALDFLPIYQARFPRWY
jgi:hypothetical protein